MSIIPFAKRTSLSRNPDSPKTENTTEKGAKPHQGLIAVDINDFLLMTFPPHTNFVTRDGE